MSTILGSAALLFACVIGLNLLVLMWFDRRHPWQVQGSGRKANVSIVGSIKQLGCVLLGFVLGKAMHDVWLPSENLGTYCLMLLVLLVGIQLRSSGITLPFEQDGFLPTPTNREQRHLDNPTAFPYGDWYPGDNVNVAIGQGDVLVTPVQLANAFATFANGGTLLSPNVVSSVRTRDGDEVRDFGPRQVGFVDIDPEFHDIVLAGLSGVTSDEEGTAYWAFNSTATGGVYFPLEQVPIAGKTGTAEVRGKADTSLFVAFGPAELPTHAIAAVIEEAGFGIQVAAPLVARLMKAVFTDGIDEAPIART
jgi:cell division protein FtsI/penicillin-binding protein 2